MQPNTSDIVMNGLEGDIYDRERHIGHFRFYNNDATDETTQDTKQTES